MLPCPRLYKDEQYQQDCDIYVENLQRLSPHDIYDNDILMQTPHYSKSSQNPALNNTSCGKVNATYRCFLSQSKHLE
jgi:hypothetical protein